MGKYKTAPYGNGKIYLDSSVGGPLGAEMFLRAYSDKNPSFKEYPQLFRGLWEDSVKRLKDIRVIRNLGFRGQGDTSFWEQYGLVRVFRGLII
ncbi:glycosyl hydrolase 115 family protein [Enterocloster citroniae]|nr:glycosyl hydrolase 115 family protein [Enterocloster citroniae]MCB7062752.1 glycosyl hydrolase 115 family protein [Enterocloster citroniae]MCD8277340.1 glycosyl hydrolase 115 family protein [Enterocloster citroniae]